jgi:3-oxoacyl-[acyl-carrier protein] reductase
VDLGLSGRVAVVTGGSQGIGRAVALELARQGASVVLCARRPSPLDAVAGEVVALGARAVPVPADVTDPETGERVATAALDAFGRIDILVNNAGKGFPKPLLDCTSEEWLASIELNLLSAVRMSLACVPHMRAAGWGRVVNVSSRVGLEPDPYFAPYAAAKAALINFSKSLANAYSGEGVLTNCVVPGLIESEPVFEAAQRTAAASGRTADEVMAEVLRRRPIPAGRLGHPNDVAGLVVFLCSDRASWITGGCFTVDGGIVRGAP